MNDRNLNLYRDAYLSKYGFEREQVKYRRRHLLEILSHDTPTKILEVGCGIESLAGFYTTFTEFTIVEPVKEFLDRVQVQLGNKVRYVNKKFEDAVSELQTETFDFIIISSLIHELSHPDVVIQAARELAGPDTIIHVNTPNAKSIHRLLGVKMGLSQHVKESSELADAFQRHQEYELSDLVQLARKHGLRVRDKGSYFLKPLSHGQMYALLEGNKISKDFLDGLYTISHLLQEHGSEIFVNLQLNETCP